MVLVSIRPTALLEIHTHREVQFPSVRFRGAGRTVESVTPVEAYHPDERDIYPAADTERTVQFERVDSCQFLYPLPASANTRP